MAREVEQERWPELDRNLLRTLRNRELATATQTIAAETGLGQSMTAVVRGGVTWTFGRHWGMGVG
ncbi:MAG: hypothetical protein WCY08_16695 [Rhodocyclaceae bacterium]